MWVPTHCLLQQGQNSHKGFLQRHRGNCATALCHKTESTPTGEVYSATSCIPEPSRTWILPCRSTRWAFLCKVSLRWNMLAQEWIRCLWTQVKLESLTTCRNTTLCGEVQPHLQDSRTRVRIEVVQITLKLRLWHFYMFDSATLVMLFLMPFGR